MVVVFVAVECQRALRAGAEHGAVFRCVGHHVRRAVAADMAVQADHPVRGAHDHVQLVADHQHGATEVVAHLFDTAIERGRAGLVQPLRRLVEDQQVGPAQQCPRQKHALQLPHRQVAQRPPVDRGRQTRLGQRRRDRRPRGAAGQAQEAGDRDRQRGVRLQPLRHVAHAQVGVADDAAGGQRHGADERAHEGGLARAVGADDCHDFARCHGQRDVVEDRRAVEVYRQPGRLDQSHRVDPAQDGHNPSASWTADSIRNPAAAALEASGPSPVVAVVSATRSQARQIRKAGTCRSPIQGAGDEGRAFLDTVHQTLCDEEVQRPVGDRRLAGKTVGLQPGQHVVGAHGTVLFQQDL